MATGLMALYSALSSTRTVTRWERWLSWWCEFADTLIHCQCGSTLLLMDLVLRFVVILVLHVLLLHLLLVRALVRLLVVLAFLRWGCCV